MTNTLIFVIGSVTLPFVLGFVWAIVLNEKFRFSELLRGITLIDWIIPSTAIGFLWMWIFNGDYGVLNGLLRELGIIEENINFWGAQIRRCWWSFSREHGRYCRGIWLF